MRKPHLNRQTSRLQDDLKSAVSDIGVKNVYSWTGNGNHAECVSEITFAAEMGKNDIVSSLSEDRNWDITEQSSSENGCVHLGLEGKRTAYATLNDDGDYFCRTVNSAPFSDNFEGH